MHHQSSSESIIPRHDEDAAHGETALRPVPETGAPARIWGGDADRAYVRRAVTSVAHDHWPPPADEYARVVMDVCRAVIARVSRTGSPDWSTVGFGPGHGVAGVSVEIPQPVDGEPMPSNVIVSVWELDVLESDEEGDDAVPTPDPAWVEDVRKRLHTIAGPLTHSRGITHRSRESAGATVVHYAREELLTERAAPRSSEDLVDLALTCGRLAESSRLTYELIEQRVAASSR